MKADLQKHTAKASQKQNPWARGAVERSSRKAESNMYTVSCGAAVARSGYRLCFFPLCFLARGTIAKAGSLKIESISKNDHILNAAMNSAVPPGVLGLPYRFSDERTVKFVELYGREPCLWNKRPYLRRARSAAYRRIQSGINADIEPYESGLTIQGVKMKIKNLRTGYHQELKKIRTIPGYQPKTPWFAPLHGFLAEFLDTVRDVYDLSICINLHLYYKIRFRTRLIFLLRILKH